jgi:LacI family transcriptional regulator
MVLAVRQLPGSGIPAIGHDDKAGGKLAAEHLLSLGHTRLAQLMGPEDIWSFEGRANGFRETIEQAGGTCIDVKAAVRLPTIDAGVQLAERFLQIPGERPSAVFAHNDSIAIGAIDELRQAGVNCPNDVSIVGFNDVPLTDKISPPLTTVRLPGYELGRLAAELVLSRIDGNERGANTVMLTPDLVVRGSTAPL